MADKIKTIDYGLPNFQNFGLNAAMGTPPAPKTPAPPAPIATPNSKGNLTYGQGNAALKAQANQPVPMATQPAQPSSGATSLSTAAAEPAPVPTQPAQPPQSGLFNYAPSAPVQPAPTQSFLDWSRGLTEPQKKAALAMGTSLLKSSSVASPTPISGTYGWGEAIEAGTSAYGTAQKEKEYRDNFKALTGKEPTMNQQIDEQTVKDIYEQTKTKRNTESAAKYFKENPQIDSVTIGGDTFNRMNVLGGAGGRGGAGGGKMDKLAMSVWQQTNKELGGMEKEAALLTESDKPQTLSNGVEVMKNYGQTWYRDAGNPYAGWQDGRSWAKQQANQLYIDSGGTNPNVGWGGEEAAPSVTQAKGLPSQPKPPEKKKLPSGAKLSPGEHKDKHGNKIMVYEDGTYSEIK